MDVKILCYAAISLLFSMRLCAQGVFFDGKTDKDPLKYKINESITYTVVLKNSKDHQPVTGRRLIWSRVGDDGVVEYGEGISDRPLVVTTKSVKPGFVRLRVYTFDEDNRKMCTGATEIFDGGAGVDIADIPACPLPEDFKQFWDRWMAKLRNTPYQAKLTELKTDDPDYLAYQFEIPVWEGQWNSTGYIVYPRNAEKKSLPISMRFNGYGFGPTDLNATIEQARKNRAIVVEVCRHGEAPNQPPEYYDKLEKGRAAFFCFNERNQSPETSDFFGLILRGQRAMQFAETLDIWNGREIHSTGGSMGGYQAIAAAALNPKVTYCNAFIPWAADLAGRSKFNRMGGWMPDFTEALGYFDVANLATLVRCKTDITINLGDYICPPSGQMVLFRQLGSGEKTLRVQQNMGHGASFQPNPAVYFYKQQIQ